MMTHIIGMAIVAVAYGALWHMQPARRQEHDGSDHPFPFESFLNRALEWLLLIPDVSTSGEKKEPVPSSAKNALSEAQTESLRAVLRPLRVESVSSKPRRFLGERVAVEPSISADLFKSEANTNALATGKAA